MFPLDLKGKRVLVVGLGKSGVASAVFLTGLGARVTVSDTKSEEELASEIPNLLDRGILSLARSNSQRAF
ncbi:MAG: NAD(P)-dependent oxidoreductase [Terriglobales bacterium]